MPKRLGLALSGGIARGPAHLGVLAVLEREGLVVDCVAGVSAGAFLGALYCAGLSVAELERLLPQVGWGLFARPAWPGAGGWVTFDHLERWLIRLMGDVTFDQLPRPFAVSVTDLETGLPVTVRTGRVARAVHASCAVPGFVAPIVLNGRRYADGGASNNLPVAAARALGAEVVVGVDLFCSPPAARRGPMGYALWALENFVRRSGGGLAEAEVMITPVLSGGSYFSFGAAAKRQALTVGMRAAAERVPELRAALGLSPAAGIHGQ